MGQGPGSMAGGRIGATAGGSARRRMGLGIERLGIEADGPGHRAPGDRAPGDRAPGDRGGPGIGGPGARGQGSGRRFQGSRAWALRPGFTKNRARAWAKKRPARDRSLAGR
jgi:hypothetical protein